MLEALVSRSRARLRPASILAPVLLAAAACSAPRAEPERVVRLVERTPEVRVENPGSEPPAGLELAPPSVAVADPPPGLAAVHRPAPGGDDLRTAFVAPVGTRFRFDGLPAGAGELRTGIAAWSAGAEPARVVFRALGGADARVLSEVEVVATPRGGWRNLKIPFAAGASRELVLEAEGAAGAWAAWATPEIVRNARRRAPRTNILLISLDTLRADRLGSYGYRRRPTSPSLDAFAARAIRFETAVAQAPWTRPSHRCLLSGRYPSFADDKSTYLAARLWRQGYRTLALTGGGQIDRRFGFARGFDSYRKTSWEHRPEAVLEALDENPDRDFLLFLHTYEIHDPFTDRRFARGLPSGRLGRVFGNRHRKFIRGGARPEEREYIEALYDGDLAYTDGQLGELFAGLERRGLLDTTIVLITSDHGEEFWEHGRWRHGHSFYDELLRVPLLLWLPPALRARVATAFPAVGERAVVEDQVGLVDVVPTLLELIGSPRTPDLQGRSMAPLLRGERLPERPLLAERLNPIVVRVRAKALRTGRFKLILPTRPVPGHPEASRPELYDLRADPGERVDLAAADAALVERLSDQLRRLAAGGAEEDAGDEDAVDDELRRELEALGYVDG